MADEHGPTICQLIGEPFTCVWYTSCVECKIETCPIRRILRILEKIAPEEIRDMKEEAMQIRFPRRPAA